MQTVAQVNPASSCLERSKQAVYQIRVIDVASGDQSGIRSGFQVSADGLIGTNFHVVSALVHEPRKYRLGPHSRRPGSARR
ncbi:MAG: hypothetical protein IPG64_22015 [Haliea sp.]|nr:hypothetical protein [Haliea sp.]